MAVEICPACQARAPLSLEGAGAGSPVHYYRCGECCFVFSLPKQHPEAPPTPVTLPEMARAWRAASLALGLG